MDERHPIRPDTRVDPERSRDADDRDADRFREALSRWATTVTVVATRDDGAVHATTVTSFAPVSARPPAVVISLGAGAQVLPFLAPDGRLGVSILSEQQRRWASVFTDSFPVHAPAWSEGEAPLLPDAVAGLTCTVRAIHPADGGGRLLLCRVDEVVLGEGDRPLLYWRRGYLGLPPG